MILWFFDSWLGGKVVLEEFQKEFPRFTLLLEMDREHCPFWNLSHEAICEYTIAWVERLFERWADVVILACNTSSVHALRLLQQEIFPDQHILGVMIPWAEKVVEMKYTEIWVLATDATVRTRAYKERVNFLDESIQVEEIGAPWIVPLIEAGMNEGEEIEALLRTYLWEFSPEIQALVLGCTHFPMIRESIEKVWLELHPNWPTIAIIDPWYEAAKKFRMWLVRHFGDSYSW